MNLPRSVTDKLKLAAQQAERSRTDTGVGPAGSTYTPAPTMLAVCMDATADADGNYPAVIVVQTEDNPEEWEYGEEEVRVRPLNGAAPEESACYIVRPSHTGRTSGLAVYSIDDAGGTVGRGIRVDNVFGVLEEDVRTLIFPDSGLNEFVGLAVTAPNTVTVDFAEADRLRAGYVWTSNDIVWYGMKHFRDGVSIGDPFPYGPLAIPEDRGLIVFTTNGPYVPALSGSNSYTSATQIKTNLKGNAIETYALMAVKCWWSHVDSVFYADVDIHGASAGGHIPRFTVAGNGGAYDTLGTNTGGLIFYGGIYGGGTLSITPANINPTGVFTGTVP